MGKRGERKAWDVLIQPGLTVRSSLFSRYLGILHRSEEKKINTRQKYVFLEIMRGKLLSIYSSIKQQCSKYHNNNYKK